MASFETEILIFFKRVDNLNYGNPFFKERASLPPQAISINLEF